MKSGFTATRTGQKIWNTHFELSVLEWQQLLLPWGPSHLMYMLGLF